MRWDHIDWDKQPLGKTPDQAIADRLGCSRPTVSVQRRVRKIPAFKNSVKRHGIDWDAQPLGRMPDRVLGKRLDRCSQTIAYHREKRSIPRFGDGLMVRRVHINIDADVMDAFEALASQQPPGEHHVHVHELIRRTLREATKTVDVSAHREASVEALFEEFEAADASSSWPRKQDDPPTFIDELNETQALKEGVHVPR